LLQTAAFLVAFAPRSDARGKKIMVPSTLGLLSVLLLTAPLPLPKLVVPNFPDLTIKTLRTDGNHYSNLQTLYLKGTRQRSEYVMQNAGSSMNRTTITQCDQKLRLDLNGKDKMYASFPVEEWATRAKRARPAPQQEMSGADVTVIIDSVDTGGRRKMGNHELRHVKTTTKVEPGRGAVMQPSVTEVDGWYIDLPGLSCQESRGPGFGYLAAASGKRDRVQIKRLGTAPRGYAVEENTRRTEAGRTTISKVELLEFSEAPLDASLFELPADYRPALRTARGGFDMTRPDTFGNRLQSYWAGVQKWFR
jgi:hypothetical protein